MPNLTNKTHKRKEGRYKQVDHNMHIVELYNNVSNGMDNVLCKVPPYINNTNINNDTFDIVYRTIVHVIGKDTISNDKLLKHDNNVHACRLMEIVIVAAESTKPSNLEEEFGLVLKHWRLSKSLTRKECAKILDIETDLLLIIEAGLFQFNSRYATATNSASI